MPPDSPNPRSTQEVERFDCEIERGERQEPDRAVMEPAPNGDFVTYEGHQRLLQAEVEKREEVEEERDRYQDWFLTLRMVTVARLCEERDQANSRAEAAESKLSSVVEELKDRIKGQRAAEDDRAMLVRERAHLLVRVYEEVLQLLRDKGTEQGAGVGEKCRCSEKPQVQQQGLLGRPAGRGEELMAETIYDGPPSPADNERALVELAAERDQLRQQVERLLEATDDLGEYLRYRPGDPIHRLYKLADQVRKELGE